MPEFLSVRVHAAVATVVLDHPPANTLGDAVLEELSTKMDELGGRDDVRAVVLAGAGQKAFASGADLTEFAAMLSSREAIERHVATSRRAFGALAALPQPVVAAVQASAVGGGLELALACDFIVADERARLGLPEVGLGLIPGAGGTQRLPRRIGPARAAQLILLGRLLKVAEATAIGLVDEVAPAGDALERATALADRLAARPALAVRAAKLALRKGADLPLAEGLDVEREQFLRVFGTTDAGEGVVAFLERRDPVFNHH